MGSAATLAGVPHAARVRAPSPLALYWLLMVPAFGGIALFTIAGPLSLAVPNRDLWQHIAVLNVLIEDPWQPRNPFVGTGESSRSFGPFWVVIALFARVFALDAVQALGLAAAANMALLAAGIRLFGRRWLRSDWGPLALAFTMLLGGSLLPVVHTGFHSPTTLIEGASYPAVTMVALGLIHWSATIAALEDRRMSVARLGWLALLSGIAVANHQLGAAILLLVAGCLACSAPAADLARRGAVLGAMLAGLTAALAWPYHNPLAVVAQVADPRWGATDGLYHPAVLLALMTPALLGIRGFVAPPAPGYGRPMLSALALFVLAQLAGATPYLPVGHRFLMPTLLLLHIGLAAVLLESVARVRVGRDRRGFAHVAIAAMLFASISTLAVTRQFVAGERAERVHEGDLTEASAALLADLPGDAGIAAHGIAAWPVVAGGHAVLSVPWPEPLIRDLAARQRDNDRLFDPRIPAAARRVIAVRRGIGTLVLDRRIAVRATVLRLAREHGSYRRAGNLIRIDLPRVSGRGGRAGAAAARSAG